MPSLPTWTHTQCLPKIERSREAGSTSGTPCGPVTRPMPGYQSRMIATIKSKVSCEKCHRSETVKVIDERIYGIGRLAEVADVLEDALAMRGWEFITAEVESADGGLEFIAAFHCAACSDVIRSYLARVPW